MKGLVVLLVGGLGFGAFWRRLRQRPAVDTPSFDPAAELRAKLAESKAAAGDESVGQEAAPAEPVLEPPPSEPQEADTAERRRAIHDRARGAIDELG